MSGTVSGSYLSTTSKNQVYQSITERSSGGKPQNRHSYLVHKWGFNVPAGNVVTFAVNGYMNQSTDDDDFVFAYSTDGVNYTDMVTVTKTQADDSYQSYMLPNTTQGQVYVRVMDTNQMAGHKTLDTIYIDHMYISIETVPGDPPASPSDLAAADVAATQVDLTWLHESEDESGFEVERSADGTTWTLIGSAGAGSTAYSDYEVSPHNTYHYRVRAFNPSGFSAYADGLMVNTPDGLSLSATGYKLKGVQHGDLSWSGVTTGVDIYRDGTLIALDIAGSSYDDNIGVKGGGAYEYYICDSSLPAECSNTVSVIF